MFIIYIYKNKSLNFFKIKYFCPQTFEWCYDNFKSLIYLKLNQRMNWSDSGAILKQNPAKTMFVLS